MLKYNIPGFKGPATPANATKSSWKRANPGARPKKEYAEDKKPDRPAEGSCPGDRSPHGPRKFRVSRRAPRRSRSRRRAAASSPADSLVGKRVRDERVSKWSAGEDSKGSLGDKCKNCYIGLGADAPRHVGRSR